MREVVDLDYAVLIPEYILGLLAVAIIALDLLLPKMRKQALPVITGAGLIGALIVSLPYIDTTDDFAGLFFVDNYTTFFRCFFIAVTFAVVVASYDFVQKYLHNAAEYYSLLLLSTVGAIVMAGAEELLTAYLGLE